MSGICFVTAKARMQVPSTEGLITEEVISVHFICTASFQNNILVDLVLENCIFVFTVMGAKEDCVQYYLDEVEAEVEDTLQKIDAKYSVATPQTNDDFDQSLAVLSQELDSLGLPPLDLSQPFENQFRLLVDGAHSLVNICRTTVVQTKNASTESRVIAAKRAEIQSINNDLKAKIQKNEERKNVFENQICRLKTELQKAKQREEELKRELQTTKRYYQTKEKGYLHDIRRLIKENQKLQEKCRLDISMNPFLILFLFYVKFFSVSRKTDGMKPSQNVCSIPDSLWIL
ncbi:unnamed protein product [Acanthoscelides obtectus]|uniref:Uncharacterized protein n=1 Tax=Acanthoscelides obtectus TaxID=200917 RepID=A0A9P0LGU3_ACAOB|nr:unnamed protein product [Acanthoscelides obtectus]CAK1671351.1 hypothetical protein AOBTE_LOCUS28230 [Acanthoscelides obtectus]